MFGHYLVGNNDSYEGGRSLSADRRSVPLAAKDSGWAVAITLAIVSRFGTGCISEECGWLLGWPIQQNTVPQCLNSHMNAMNATNMVSSPATVPTKSLVPTVVLRSPLPWNLKIHYINYVYKTMFNYLPLKATTGWQPLSSLQLL